MKKGFTLVELLAILAILGAVILVSVPSIISTNKNSREELKTVNGTAIEINTEDLVASGVIQGTLVNPKTDVQLINEPSKVNVKNQNGTLIYNYVAP